MWARFSVPVQTGPGAHPTSYTMGTGSFLGVKCGRGVTLTPHPLLVPWSRKSRAIPLLPLWAVRPVQSRGACTRVHFTFTFCIGITDYIFICCFPPIYRSMMCVRPCGVTSYFSYRPMCTSLSSSLRTRLPHFF